MCLVQLHNQASLPQSRGSREDLGQVGLVSVSSESTKSIELNTGVNLDRDFGSAVSASSLASSASSSGKVGSQLRRLEGNASDETLVEEGGGELQSGGWDDAGGDGDLAAQSKALGLDDGADVDALAESEARAVGQGRLDADGGGSRCGEAGDGGLGDELQLRADGDDVGDGEAGQGGAEDGDVGGQRRSEATAGSEADLEDGAEAVGRRDRGLEAVGQRERDVGVERALRVARRARDAEVDAVDGGAVDGAGEVVAHINGHILANGASAGARGRSAADSDAGVLGEALPRGLGGSQRGRVGRGVVGDGLDGEGLSAAVAGASITFGDIDDGVGGRLVDPGPGSLGSLQGGGAVELDGDVLGAAVD